MENTQCRRSAEYEITKEGWLLCAAAGLLEELAVFAVLGIELLQTPVPVFLVLWAAFGIISSGLLTFAAFLRDRSAAAVKGRCQMECMAFPVKEEAFGYDQGYAFAAQRKAS